jgi:hypothetical protein
MGHGGKQGSRTIFDTAQTVAESGLKEFYKKTSGGTDAAVPGFMKPSGASGVTKRKYRLYLNMALYIGTAMEKSQCNTLLRMLHRLYY